LHQFGLHIGFAFQIKDDILGIWGNPELTGKSIESDLMSHKNTLPIVYGISQSPLFQQLWKAGITSKNIGKTIQCLNEVHALEYSEKMVKQNSEKALWNLEQVRGNELKKTLLIEFVNGLINRFA
jgi:geranylgeranyl diphosphate synthase type I